MLGRPAVCRRQLIDGIRWRVWTGAPWRGLPPEYGPWQTVHGLFRRRQRDGTREAVLTGLQARADAAGLITWDVNVDSTICRARQHAAGARRDGRGQKEPPGGIRAEPDDHGLGRSRGGWTTKIHLACEQGQKPLSLLVAAGRCWAAGRQPAVRGGAGSHPGTSPGTWPAPRSSAAGAGRQGVFVAGEACVLTSAGHPLHDCGTRRPGRSPQTSGFGWRAASGFRP
ncbi:transposase [Streptomyces sp. NPDC059037]|uniref:transposase n=1 Tax=Streptomyces sp. NPDC059037 TaxID=3346710 RepID=UPI003691FDB1